MFEKLEEQKRPDGAFYNQWARTAFETLLIVQIMLFTDHLHYQANAMLQAWWEPRNPLSTIINDYNKEHGQ